MKHSPKIITRIALIASLTLTLTLLGMSGHTARIKPRKEMTRNSTPTQDTSKLTAYEVHKVTVAKDNVKRTSVGRTYTWQPESGGMDQPKWTTAERNNWVRDDGEREGMPGEGDTAILDSDVAGQFRDYVYLDQDITINTLIMRGLRDPSRALYTTLRSTPSGPHKLTVTHRFEWSEGRIIGGAEVVAGENSVVTIAQGSLGDNNVSNGSLTINGTGSISGLFKIEKGGTLTVGPNAMLTIDTASPVVVDSNSTLASTLEILGTTTITGTGGIAVTTLGAINVSGTLDLHTDAALSSNCDCAMTVNAGGTLVKSAGNGISSIGLIVNNAGTVSANAGTLAFSRSLSQSAGATILNGGNLSLAQSPLNLNGGILAGKGTVTGNVINAGIVSPGYPQNTAGQLTIAGDYTQEAVGKLEIDIGSTAEGQFDRIVSNVATLSGTLDVRLINNFHPACNDSFDIAKYTSSQGSFSVVNGIDLGSARNLTLDPQPETLRILAQGIPGQDTDDDGESDACDNCPNTSNDQNNFDHDRDGDACDNDDDNDGVIDSEDAFPLDASEWIDTDHDGSGDNADNNDDNDCFLDPDDAFPLDPTKFLNPYTLDPTAPHIVFKSNRDGNAEIYGMSEDGRGVVRLTNSATDDTEPKLSPDRRKIAFTSKRHGNYEIYWMDSDGTGVTRLTNDPEVDRTPAWSPDGKRIVFTSARGGKNRIYSINVADCRGESCPPPDATLLNDQEGVEPVWSPNGCQIAFAGRPGSAGMYVIFSMDHDGNNLRTLTSTIGQNYPNHHPTWSPGGSRIAFIRRINGFGFIYTMNPDGSSVRVLALGASASEPAWGINGRIVFRRESNQELYSVDSKGSWWTRLTINTAYDSWPDW